MDSFEGQLAVVTGGGTGMGRELTIQLAAAGCSVATCDVANEALAETVALASAGAPDGTLVTGHHCDVSDEPQVIAFRDEALARHGRDTAAQAATIILDGVRAGQWRILVGEDARKLDEWVRANPDTAYDRRTR